LVVADVLQEIGQYGSASKWYAAARMQALAIGDDAALSAMLYNRAAIRIFNVRLDEIAGGVINFEEEQIALQTSSAQNYTNYISDRSMRWGFDLMAGQLSMLRGDFVHALEQFESDQFSSLAAQWPGVDCVRNADIIRCRIQGEGRLKSTDLSVVEELLCRIDVLSAPSDRAIALYSLAIAIKPHMNDLANRIFVTANQQIELVAEDRQSELTEISRFLSEFATPLALIEEGFR
jgi:hypothetical protein